MKILRLGKIAFTAGGAAILVGCLPQEEFLSDTLQFEPGTRVTYKGQQGRLYGHDACALGMLKGNSCVIFPPNKTKTEATILVDGTARSVVLTAKRDPQMPTHFVVLDEAGKPILRTSGRHDEMANISIID